MTLEYQSPMAPQNEIISEDEALALMPALTKNKFKDIHRNGDGPAYAFVGRHLRFRRADVVAWYERYAKTLFKTGKPATATRKTSVAKAAPKKTTKKTAADTLA